jgi:hypothetical protein
MSRQCVEYTLVSLKLQDVPAPSVCDCARPGARLVQWYLWKIDFVTHALRPYFR